MKLSHNSSCGRRPEALPMVRKICQLGVGMGALLLLSSGNVLAQRIHVVVNGSPVRFEGIGPVQLEGHTLVPVRGVLEKLGAEVAWVPSSQTVIASAPRMHIQLQLGDREANVNGNRVPLDVPAQEINGHTMVPLRFLGEALGADVRWDDAARTVIIVTHERRDRPEWNRDRNRRPGDVPQDRRPGDLQDRRLNDPNYRPRRNDSGQ